MVHIAHDVQVRFAVINCTIGIVMAMIKDKLEDDSAEVRVEDQGQFTPYSCIIVVFGLLTVTNFVFSSQTT